MSERDSAGVLDLRERIHTWRWRPATSTVTPHEQAKRHGCYDAILRDGMVVLESRDDPEPTHPFWRPVGTYSRADLERLREVINDALRGAGGRG